MTSSPVPAPRSFVRGDFVAECHEHRNGSRCIRIYNRNLENSYPAMASLFDPVMIFKFAGWMVKASEWVGEEKILRVKKRNRNKIQPSKD
jgi:hypothetical protein